MTDAAELRTEAEYCRDLARQVDRLTQRILLEVAEQYEAEARLVSAYPNNHHSSSRRTH